MVRKSSRQGSHYTIMHKGLSTAPPARTIRTRSCSLISNISYLQTLPPEVFHLILDQLSVVDISIFSMVSKENTQHVIDYISTAAWKTKMVIEKFHPSTSFERASTFTHYRRLGLLYKRCTLLMPTKERLKLIFNTFSQIPCFMLEQCHVPGCIGFFCCGVFLQMLIAGWDEQECLRVFHFLCELTNLLQKTEAVLTSKPGMRSYQEMQLRLFCRHVLLDQWLTQSDSEFWLTQLLKPWPLASQAHLLFIFYGPELPEGSLGWQDVMQRGLSHTVLYDLSQTVLLLFSGQEMRGWSSILLLSVLEELIAIPRPWHVENVARLLALCGYNLCYTFLASKAVNGRVHELTRLIVYMILVSEREGYRIGWLVRLVQQLWNTFVTLDEKFNFIQKLENTFVEVTREFFEFYVSGNHLDDRENFRTLCILLDSSARFHTKFLHVLMK